MAHRSESMDRGLHWPSSWGTAGSPFTSADQSASPASVTGAPNGYLVVDDLFVSVDTDMSVTFKEETSGTVVFGPVYMPARSLVQITPRARMKLPTNGKKLQVQTSVAGNVSVLAGYHSELADIGNA